jgi:hypothetical protein
MATIDIRRDEPVNNVGYGQDVDRSEYRWAPIFSTALLIVGFQLMFILLGNAIGLDLRNTAAPVGGALKFWSWIYAAATLIFSFYVGSVIGTRSRNLPSIRSCVKHALVGWGLACAVDVLIGAISGLGFRGILAGGPNTSASWLAACVIVVGLLATVAGGASSGVLFGRFGKRREGGGEERHRMVA